MRNQSAEGPLLVSGAAGDSLTLGEWTVASSPPNAIAEPGQLHAHKLSWVRASVPGTVAQALAAAQRWDFDDDDDFDASDWWFRASFEAIPDHTGTRSVLRVGGIATLAQVWLNGRAVLASTNMFESHDVDVTDVLQARNELVICCRSLGAALASRRPRPRWKTKLVRQQQLRWMRTTLLGRIPGWTPPAAPVGPWRPVTLEPRRPGSLWDVSLRSLLDGPSGVVSFSACTLADDGEVSGELIVGDARTPIVSQPLSSGARVRCDARLESIEPWWPHTHGAPTLHPCRLRLLVHGETHEIDLGAIGFRRIDVDEGDGRFGLRVNDEPIFCRGVCWTPLDAVGLTSDERALRDALVRLCDAGANMVRVSGTMVYEDDAFYRLCDELGLMVWQDFMFANMDYPADDESFVDSVRREARQHVGRLARHACVAVYCGNSEVEQQAAMLGIPRDGWRNRLFADVLPSVCAELHPGVPYVPSTPSGGALPFHTRVGLTHYYGVGAYLRPFSDVRHADVKFTPECLGFANVPEPDLVDVVMRGDPPATHDPRWKRRTPRDTGAGWDFEDVRDHYMHALFGVDAQRLRFTDTRRYLDLARVATGEVMARVYAEWRSGASACRGALVWFHRDLWPGAGWGIVDSRGVPKACYYYLRRAWQPIAVFATDEGLNGVRLHVVNEQRAPWRGALELCLVRDGTVIVAEQSVACMVGARGTTALEVEDLLGGFYDSAYAYRFGAPSFDVLAATLRDADGDAVASALHCPVAIDVARHEASVRATAARLDEATWRLTVQSDRLLYGVRIDAPGFAPEDNYFSLLPERPRRVRLHRTAAAEHPRGYVESLNLRAPARIELEP